MALTVSFLGSGELIALTVLGRPNGGHGLSDRDSGSVAAFQLVLDHVGDGLLGRKGGGCGPHPLSGPAHPDQGDGLGIGQGPVHYPAEQSGVLAVEVGHDGHDRIPAGEDLAGTKGSLWRECLGHQVPDLVDVGRRDNRPGGRGALEGVHQLGDREARLPQLSSPARDQLALGLVSLGPAGGAGGHVAGPVAVEALGLDLGVDLRRPLGVHLQDRLGDAGDAPVAQPPRRARVGLDAIAQLDRHPGGGQTADHGRGVQVLSPGGGVGRLPPAALVRISTTLASST